MVLIAAVWATEVFWVQEATFVLDVPIANSSRWLHFGFRYSNNFLVALSLLLFLSKHWVFGAMSLSACASTLLYSYFEYFNRPLSLLTIAHQADEGAESAASLLSLLEWSVAATMLFILSAKLLLLSLLPRLNVRGRLKYAPPIFALVALCLMTQYVRPIELKSWRSNSFWGHLYGYTPLWVAEFLSTDDNRLLAEAERAKRVTSSRIPAEWLNSLALTSNLVVIQAESLDFDMIKLSGERPAMPFLQSLTAESFCVPIRALHLTGSADADFALLTGHMPNGRVPPYLDGLKIELPTPEIASLSGFRTEVFHGNRGTFFNRRRGFSALGFDRVFFEEELQKNGLSQSEWGIADHEVFEFAAERLAASSSPAFQLIITLTTHAPWTFTPEVGGVGQPVPKSSRQRLINSMRYLDSSIETFYAKLPVGTVLVIYGDHNSGISLDSDSPSRERVPLIISKKGSPFEQRIELCNELSMLDAASAVRALLSGARNRNESFNE